MFKKGKISLVVSVGIIIVSFSLITACELLGLLDGFGRIGLEIQGTAPGELASASANVAESRAAAVTTDIIIKSASGVVQGTLTLTDARIALKDIEFDMASDDADTAEELLDNESVEFIGPFIIDLLNNTSEPEFDMADLLPGRYTEIELDLDDIDDEDIAANPSLLNQTDPLFERSIYLAGTYTGLTAGGEVTDAPFSFAYELHEEFELAAPDAESGITVANQTYVPVIIAFRLASWFDFTNSETNSDNKDFSNITLTNGAIVLDEISEGDNNTIINVLKENIKESADFGEDGDDSGVLESDEDEDPASEDEMDD